jgi:hypothetical protein
MDLPRNNINQSKLQGTGNHSKFVAICHGIAMETATTSNEKNFCCKSVSNKDVKKFLKYSHQFAMKKLLWQNYNIFH